MKLHDLLALLDKHANGPDAFCQVAQAAGNELRDMALDFRCAAVLAKRPGRGGLMDSERKWLKDAEERWRIT